MDFYSFLITFLLFLPSAKPASDHSTLVYKTCATQTFADPYSQALHSLFAQLVAESSQSRFFKTMEIGNDDTAISGLFQCREDISREDCFRCVNLLPQMSNTLCRHSVAARVQLDGCYTQYDTEGVSGTGESESSNRLLHKVCGESTVSDEAYAKFRELIEVAFAALERGIDLNSTNGYYKRNYESVEMMAQCEGDLDACECSECVSDAAQVAEEQCTTSISGQIYLAKCFISYIYHPEPHGNSSPGNKNNNNNNNTEKVTALIAGGAAALLVGFVFLFFLKSRCTKDEFD